MPPLTCLDCSRCLVTFSAEPGLPTSPVCAFGDLSCSKCAPNVLEVPRSAIYIIEMLLGQPVTRITAGWQIDGPLTPWACNICDRAYKEKGKQKAIHYDCCQQLTCSDCYHSQRFRHEDDCQGERIQITGKYRRVIREYQEAVRVQALEEADYEYVIEINRKPIEIETQLKTKAEDVPYVPYVLQDRPEVKLNPEDLKASCKDCKRTYEIHDVFLCLNCDEATLCGICCFKDHKSHECVELKERKLANLEKTTSEFLSQYYAGLHGNIRGVHAEIDDGQKALVKVCEESLKLVPGQKDYGIGAKICAELRAAADDYEKCFEAYLPHARMYGTNLQKLKEIVEKFVEKCVASE